jgi:DNA mismatch repair ATPase MutS
MGVPAKSMQLTLFEGILTNINVEDNLVKGESYFFNEVKRIKETILKITNGKRWLVLIDEIFKGTNIQDAMKCSLAVIKGLIKMENGLFILSTHLYEIGEDLKQLPSISFKCSGARRLAAVSWSRWPNFFRARALTSAR